MEALITALIILAQVTRQEYRFSLVALLLFIDPFLYAVAVPALALIRSDLSSYTLYLRDIIVYGLVVLAFRPLSFDILDVVVILLALITVWSHLMGMGDVYLFAIGALATDVFGLWSAVLVSCIGATFYALVTGRRRLPFGPFIIVGHLWVWLLL